MRTLCIGLFALAVAQSPSAPSSIPTYPGAENIGAPPAEFGTSTGETLRGLPGGMPLLTSSDEMSLAGVPVEQVVAYYRKIFPRVTDSGFEAWAAVDPLALARGSSTPIHHQQYDDQGVTKYLYHWYRRERSGDVVLSELRISASFDPRHRQRQGPITAIVTTRKTYSAAAPRPGPDEQTLGAPIYPSAVYDPNDSRTLADGALAFHAFLSQDEVGKVVAFYEGRLGRKALKGDPPGGGVTWSFLGYSPVSADDRVTIQEETRRGVTYRTLITFTLNRIDPP